MKTPPILNALASSVKPALAGNINVQSRMIDSFNNPFGSDTHHNLLVSSVYNQADKQKRSWMRNSLPSQDLGMSILLTSISSSSFFEKLRQEEINLVLSLTNVTNAWARTVTDLHNPSLNNTANSLGLTNLSLGLSGIDPDNKEFVSTFMSKAMISIVAQAMSKFSKEIADKKKTDALSKSKRHESYTYRNSRQGMAAVEEVNERFLSHIRSVLNSFNINKFFDILIKDNVFNDGDDKEMFYNLISSGVIGFVNDGDEYYELFKLYLLSVTTQVNVDTKTLGYTASDWENNIIKGIFDSAEINKFVNTGVALKGAGSGDVSKVDLNSLWSELQKELSRNIHRNSSLSLLSIKDMLRNITSFKHEFVKFIDDQSSFLTESYKKGDELFRAYKSFLIAVKNTTDTISANELLLSFRSTKLFTNSMAGLIHGMCENRESMDVSIVNDIAQIVVDEQVIAAFNRGPFKDIAKLRLISPIISDYGTGIKGMSYEVYYESERAFTFDKASTIQFAKENPSTGLLAATAPWSSKACLEEYMILGSLAINDPKLRVTIAGGTDMTNFRTEISPNKVIRDMLEPALRMLNNAMSVQMYIHHTASKAWYKQYLLGMWDYSAYFKNVFDLKESFLSHHPFRAKIEENLKIFRDEISGTLSDMFALRVENAPSNTLPVIKVEMEDGSITSEPQTIMNELMDLLHKSSSFMHIMEDIRMVKRFMSRVGKEGTSFLRSGHINEMKESELQNVASYLSFSDSVMGVLEVRPSLELTPGIASIEEAKKQMFRNFDSAEWLYLFDVDDTLSMLNTTTAVKQRSKADRSKFGYHAEEYSYAPQFVTDLVRTMAAERLVNYYQMDTFAGLNFAKAIRNLSGVALGIMKLAVDGREGMSVGLSPTAITFTSNSDYHTFSQILANIGLNEDMSVRLDDTTFFAAVAEASGLGFPLKLTPQLSKKLQSYDPSKQDASDSKEVETIRLKDALALSNAFSMNKSVLKTFTIYIRDTKIINFMLNDVIMESFLDDYQLIQIKDDYIKALIGNESQDKFLAVTVKEALAIEDISNSATIAPMLRKVAEEVAGFFFPRASLESLSNTKPVSEEEEIINKEEEEDQ